MAERIQKLLASAGLGSRREIERWISAGRIAVNGETATLGQSAELTDKFTLDGKYIKLDRSQLTTEVLLYYKPEGQLVTRVDPEGRDTIFAHIRDPEQGRWITIGRLDINTSGLLLLTNNGELARRLMHPSYAMPREYACRVLGEVTDAVLTALTQGVTLEDGPAKFDQLYSVGGGGANTWWHGVIKEGRNREVRRLWESQGLTVSRLSRVRFGNIQLPRDLARGRGRLLARREVNELLQAVQMPTERIPVKPDAALRKSGGGGRPAGRPSGRSTGRSSGRAAGRPPKQRR